MSSTFIIVDRLKTDTLKPECTSETLGLDAGGVIVGFDASEDPAQPQVAEAGEGPALHVPGESLSAVLGVDRDVGDEHGRNTRIRQVHRRVAGDPAQLGFTVSTGDPAPTGIILQRLAKFLAALRKIGIRILVTDTTPPKEIDGRLEVIGTDPADRPGDIRFGSG